MKPIARHLKREAMGISIYGEMLLEKISYGNITVMALIKYGEEMRIAKQATLHKTIKALADEKFIHMKVSEGDNRVRICSIATRGKNYLNSL
jgi:DNA-binding MarR family transcriptional regulator